MDTSAVNIKMCEKAEEIQAILDYKHYIIENVFAVKEKKKECIHEGNQLSDYTSVFLSYSYDKLYCELCGKKLKEYEAEFIETYSIKPSDEENRRFIWLPRQDQLQEMLTWRGLKIVRFGLKLGSRYGYYHLGSFDYHGHYGSMEQLWLGFVMREKYHKIWNGEDWVEEKKV